MPKPTGTTITRRDWIAAFAFCLLIGVVILAVIGGLAIYLEVK